MSLFAKALVMALTVSLAATPAMAEQWLEDRYDVVVRDQPLAELFREFSAMAGVPAVIAEGVDSKVSARFEGATGQEILDAVARRYGLDWRFDGRRLEVTRQDQQVTRILDMGGVPKDQLTSALRALGVYDEDFPLRSYDGALGMVSGPPSYVATVEVVLAELAERFAQEQARLEQAAERLEAERLAEERRRREAEERHVEKLRNLEIARQMELIRAQTQRERALIEQAEREALRRRLEAQRGPIVIRGGVAGG